MPSLADGEEELAKASWMPRTLLNSYTSLKALAAVVLQAAFPALLRVPPDLAWATQAGGPECSSRSLPQPRGPGPRKASTARQTL